MKWLKQKTFIYREYTIHPKNNGCCSLHHSSCHIMSFHSLSWIRHVKGCQAGECFHCHVPREPTFPFIMIIMVQSKTGLSKTIVSLVSLKNLRRLHFLVHWCGWNKEGILTMTRTHTHTHTHPLARNHQPFFVWHKSSRTSQEFSIWFGNHVIITKYTRVWVGHNQITNHFHSG